MKTILNLAYGSNLCRERIGARVKVRSVVGTVALAGWGLRFHKQGADDSGKCNLVRQVGETAYGVIYEFSAADKSILDEIEGVGNGYLDQQIKIPDLDLSGKRLQGVTPVFAYIAVPDHVDDQLVPYDWYHRYVHSGAQQCGFPPHYLEQIGSVRVKADPNEKRSRENFKVLV